MFKAGQKEPYYAPKEGCECQISISSQTPWGNNNKAQERDQHQQVGGAGAGGGGARFSEPHDMLTSNASEPADLHRKSMLTCPRL